MAHRWIVGALITAMASACVATAQTGDDVYSLKGLTGVNVDINLDGTARRRGVDFGPIRTDIELRLRRSGVRVLELGSPDLKDAGYPFLHVEVSMLCLESVGLCAYSADVKLQQLVSLKRQATNTPLMATTWESGGIGTRAIASDELARGVKELIGDVVDRFLNDYLTANPRPSNQ